MAAELFTALASLSPTPYSALPDGKDLEGYLAAGLRDARTLVSSLPQDGEPTAGQEWKVVKLSAKENPMGIGVFKLAAKDGGGTWFARRSVHAGAELGFKRFRTGLAREFDGRGGVDGGNVRGIGRERRVEKRLCEIGAIEVNYLTAQFPGPSAPRDFVIASLISSTISDDGDADDDDAGQPPSRSTFPRQFTVVSRPVLDHPDCPARQGYVRGQYESVEFIRELPIDQNPHVKINRLEGSAVLEIKRTQSVPNFPQDARGEGVRNGRNRGKTITFADRECRITPRESFDSTRLPAEDPEQNPVEWIMITRSDPGGSVPRWMVERGTPGSIVKEAEKFLDWATGNDELLADSLEGETVEGVVAGTSIGGSGSIKEGATPGQKLHEDSKLEVKGNEKATITTGGALATAINTISAGVSAITPPVIYTPSTTTASSSPSPLSPTIRAQKERVPSDRENSDTASLVSFTTAISASSHPSRSPPSSTSPINRHHPSSAHEEKALARLLREKAKLSAHLAKKIERNEKKRTRDEGREQKLMEKHMRKMEKQEEKCRRDIEKARRREEKRRERREGKERREVRELRSVVEGLTRENLELKDKVEELEKKEADREAKEMM